MPGVGFAALLAEWSRLVWGPWLVRDAFGVNLRSAWTRIGDRLAIRLMFNASRDIMGRDIMGRIIILQLCFTTFVFLGARFGDVTLAANQVLMQFLEVTAFALDGIAFAAEALVGQAIGARSARQSQQAGAICLQWGFGGGRMLAATILLAGRPLIDLMTTSAEVRIAALDYLPWLVVAPVIGSIAWVFDGIFIGAMLTREMLRMMVWSLAAYVVALLILPPVFGNHGLWAALMMLNLARALTLWRAYPGVAAKAVKTVRVQSDSNETRHALIR